MRYLGLFFNPGTIPLIMREKLRDPLYNINEVFKALLIDKNINKHYYIDHKIK